MHARHADAGGGGQVLEAAGCGVAVHPGAAGAAQDRPVGAALDGTFEVPELRGEGDGLP